MRITIDLEKDFQDIDKAIEKNIEAMNWAIKNCPVAHMTAMIDNKYIILTIMKQLKKEAS